VLVCCAHLIRIPLSHILCILHARSTQRVTLRSPSRAAKYERGPRAPAERVVDFVPERLAPRGLGAAEVVRRDQGATFVAVDPGNLGATICISRLSSLTDKVWPCV
jgi:hypothetical protein